MVTAIFGATNTRPARGLYTVARPLLFQLGDLCETGNRRIERILTDNIMPPARLDSTKLVVTTYRLIAPLVLVRLLQQRLTTVDLGLDADLRDQYRLAKDLLSVFANGHELAGPPVHEPFRSAYQEAHECAAEYVKARRHSRP